MSDLLNCCCSGYLAIPIIEACRQRGLFKLLDPREFRERKWLITELKANAGYFTIGLEALEFLGWLEKNGVDCYRLTTTANGNCMPGLTPLYAVEPLELVAQVRIGLMPSFCAVIFCRLPNSALDAVSEPVRNTPSQPR